MALGRGNIPFTTVKNEVLYSKKCVQSAEPNAGMNQAKLTSRG